jgi:hypothetical protein
MSDYTAREIEEAVSAAADVEGHSLEEGWGDLAYQDDGYTATISLRGEDVQLEMIDSKPGREGGGEDLYIVVKVGDQFFEKTGYYASHYGSDWDGEVTEVNPAQKTITVYEPVRA